MRFEEAHELWIGDHLSRRKGERRRMLSNVYTEGQMLFAKNVWWPKYKSFDGLHPEYEIPAFPKGIWYLDFSALRDGLRIVVEVDGFGSHLRDVSRYEFSNERRKHTNCTGMKWQVTRFSYDDLRDHPHICRQLFDQVVKVGKQAAELRRKLSLREREVLVYASTVSHVKAIAIVNQLDFSQITAYRTLRNLARKGYLEDVKSDKDKQRTHAYKISDAYREASSLLWKSV